MTLQLLSRIRYHGIFGIEWLHELQTGKFFLIDFNARPFTTIGHLTDSGLNLPSLAFLEMTRGLPQNLALKPKLKKVFWVDFNRDVESFHEKYRHGQLGILSWLGSLIACRSFAYFSWSDPVPGIVHSRAVVAKAFRFVVGRTDKAKSRTNQQCNVRIP